MSASTFEQLRLPAAVLLVAIAGVVLWPRGDGEASFVESQTPIPSVVVGQPGGEVISPSAAASVTPIPTLTVPTATPTPVASPTPAPAQDGFTAEVLVCRAISGSECNDPLATVPANLASFTTLVRFTDANGGDAINVTLTGPSGSTSSGPYTLDGGGDGYYYATFQAGSLPGGEYTVAATRNGTEVATTGFRKAGG